MGSGLSPKRHPSSYCDTVAAKSSHSFGIPINGRDLLRESELSAFLYQEQRRTERNRKTFVLILIKIEALTTSKTIDRSLQALRSQLSVSIRATDVVGWYENGSSIAVVFTEVPLEKRETVSELLLAKVITIIRTCIDRLSASSIPLAIQVLEPELRKDNFDTAAKPAGQTDWTSRKQEERAISEKLPRRFWRPEPIT